MISLFFLRIFVLMKINPAKQFLIFGLAFLVLFNVLGVFVVNYIETGFHRAGYSAESSNSNLLSLTVNEFKSIAWIGEHDFVYDGKVYDCESVSSSKGKINLVCNADNEETILKNAMSSNFDNGSKNIPVSKSMKEFFKVFPVFENSTATKISAEQSFSFNYSSFNNLVPKQVVLALNSPPPEFC